MSFVQFFFGKKPNQVTKDDVEEFIKRGYEENKTLDYKQIDILKNTTKLCEDVCAFANSEGGLLIVGVSERQDNYKIYPDAITWGDPSNTKEQLENKLLGNISPHVKVDIVPVRKSQIDPRVIFLIDVPKSNELHMTKHRFYKRENFQSLPMNHEEVTSFVRERLKYDECAMFRFHLKGFIISLVDELLVRLLPSFTSLEIREKIRKNVEQTIEPIIKDWKQTEITILEKTPIIQLIRFGDNVDNVYPEKLKQIELYPHDHITSEEKILFIELQQLINNLQMSILRKFFIDDAQAHKIDSDWNQSSLEFEKKTMHKDHVQNIVRAFLFELENLLENILKIMKKFAALEAQYGLFQEAPSVKYYHD